MKSRVLTCPAASARTDNGQGTPEHDTDCSFAACGFALLLGHGFKSRGLRPSSNEVNPTGGGKLYFLRIMAHQRKPIPTVGYRNTKQEMPSKSGIK